VKRQSKNQKEKKGKEILKLIEICKLKSVHLLTFYFKFVENSGRKLSLFK
jgi:hypothetical protein